MLGNSVAQSYTDFSRFTEMRRDAQQDPDASLREVAKQFESLYIQMMLKSMRDASPGDPLFDSHSSEVYRDMFDKQISLQMSQDRGIGLADMLVRQLQAATGKAQANPNNNISHVETVPVIKPTQEVATESLPGSFDSKGEFVDALWPLAEQAAEQLGTTPQVLLAQAALETGWGRHIQQRPDGQSSFNLFNIKADQRWTGPKLTIDTLEYKDGIAMRQKAAFRSYTSFAESFRDYVSFIKSSPRYQEAINNAGDATTFARKLHEAGYATDPEYSSKWLRILDGGVVSTPQSEFLAEG